MLRVDKIHSFYGTSHILDCVSLKVEKGELVTLLGRNGVGKTTTLKSIMGLVRVKSGSILFNDQNILGRKPYDIFQQGLGYVPQGRKIFSTLNVAENLRLAQGKKKDKHQLEWVLSLFPPLKGRLCHRGNHLSGGEQQMLAIGRVLVGKPEMILLDEPSEGLAPLMVKQIFNILLELKGAGITMLLVEANLEMAIKLADRHYIMDQGRIVFEPTSQQLLEDEEILDKYFRI